MRNLLFLDYEKDKKKDDWMSIWMDPRAILLWSDSDDGRMSE